MAPSSHILNKLLKSLLVLFSFGERPNLKDYHLKEYRSWKNSVSTVVAGCWVEFPSTGKIRAISSVEAADYKPGVCDYTLKSRLSHRDTPSPLSS